MAKVKKTPIPTRNVTFRVRKQHAEAFKQLVRDRVYPELKAMYANDKEGDKK